MSSGLKSGQYISRETLKEIVMSRTPEGDLRCTKKMILYFVPNRWDDPDVICLLSDKPLMKIKSVHNLSSSSIKICGHPPFDRPVSQLTLDLGAPPTVYKNYGFIRALAAPEQDLWNGTYHPIPGTPLMDCVITDVHNRYMQVANNLSVAVTVKLSSGKMKTIPASSYLEFSGVVEIYTNTGVIVGYAGAALPSSISIDGYTFQFVQHTPNTIRVTCDVIRGG